MASTSISAPVAPQTQQPPVRVPEGQEAAIRGVPDSEERSVVYRDYLVSQGVQPKIGLDVAENVLLYDLFKSDIFPRLAELTEPDIRYATPAGRPELMDRLAARLSVSFGAEIEGRHVFGTAGVSSALECIAAALREYGVLAPNDTVMLPAPFWQGFRWSFEQRPDLRCVPSHLEAAGPENFRLTVDDLETTYRNTSPRPKMLVLTNPHNPLGVNYPEDLLESVVQWALDKGMHVISDEMYRHSQITGTRPEFVSALRLEATRAHPERVHVVWGLAKDFGLSGFRTGFIVSRSPYVRKVMTGVDEPGHKLRSLAWFSPFDSLRQFLVERLLDASAPGGRPFWDTAMETYRPRLTESFEAVARVLDDFGVPYVRSGGDRFNPAQFFWLDLRSYLPTGPIPAQVRGGEDGFALYLGAPGGSATPEQQLAQRIADQANVLLLPGQVLSCKWQGYFRLCYTAYHKDRVVDAVRRMCEILPAGR
ncbi:pyridoxal phosphate-dependent aminotransferase [Marinactinospora rubrisoli]|uniref:Pyridoxal phosphate-dependent aminotransferase n=1 Tax=Marinactinospora rubrisoli TaxID=2715399 RepID=A0ABW2KIJ4_9ACTN